MLILFDVLISASKVVAIGCAISFVYGIIYWPFSPKYRRMIRAELREYPRGEGKMIAMFVLSIKPAAILGVLACGAVVHLTAYKLIVEALIERWL